MKRLCVRLTLLVTSLFLLSCSTSGSTSNTEDTGSQQDSIAQLDVVDTVPEDLSTEDSTSDVVQCTGTCDVEGAKECSGDGWRVCQDLDDDGCFDWSEVTPCQAGTACQNGTCVVSCDEQPCTVMGTHKCGDNNEVLECGNYDGTGCLDWGNPQPCAEGLVCSNGFCATTCTNACTIVGAVKCEGNSIVTCGDFNNDSCLEWGDAIPCGELVCSNGFCQSQCENECTVLDSQICDGTQGYKICNNYDSDSCLEWGSTINCGVGYVCSNGSCVSQCESECTAIGAKKCLSGGVSTCNDYNGDNCLEWGTPLNCAEGLICSNGSCVLNCENECTVSQAKSCDEGGNIVVCGDYNSDGCLEWGSPTQCQDPYVCDLGGCVLDCTNDCDAINAKTCVAGTTNQYKVCDDWDDDGCLEWGSPLSCEGSLVCSGGNCAVGCESTCEVLDQASCNEAGTAVIVCGDYNDNGCLEWGTPYYCANYQACETGACIQQDPPGTVVINEVVYNSQGVDLDVFVELKGPSGLSLNGFTLVGVDGVGGDVYRTILLNGVIPASGYFVISHPEAISAISDIAQQFDAGVDFQNSPDSIQLHYGAVEVDALGYGSFASDTGFAGEGSPVASVDAGHSLGRDATGSDTDDNSTDFFDYGTPTPGATNVAANIPPDASLACPTSGMIGQSLEFDGSASSDFDGSISLYAFDFGDDSTPATGAQSTATHSFSTSGMFTVTLTVEDNQGAMDTATCSLSIGDDNVPEVIVIKPLDNKQVTQGDVVQVLVNATAAPGRDITQVELVADGVPYGSADTQAPYEFLYTVPESQPTDSVISLQAKAVDNAGSNGYSAVTHLQVKNDLPIPSFTAVVSGALEASMDASACYDTESPVDSLEVRWDFQNDNIWDTDWSTDKLIKNTYPTDGTYTIKMAVRDEAGQIATTTREVSLSSIQYVAGQVTTTTWTGTIVITGDVTVPSGNTLTISEGTSVLFSWNDQNEDGIGDWGILVQGSLVVNGTEAKPVIFTSLGTSHKHSKAWDRITLQGSGHAISHALIEYAHVGLAVAGSGTMNDSILRFSQIGLFVSGAAAFALNDCEISGNDQDGIEMQAGTFTVNQTSSLNNGRTGAYVRGGTFNLYDSVINGNGTVGLRFYAGGGGEIMRNLITGSAYEGVRVETNGGADPNPVIQYNNIFGNALIGARVLQAVNLSASVSGQYTTTTQGPWSTPAGEDIDFVRYSYSENDSYNNYYQGYIINANGGGNIVGKSNADNGWYDLLGDGVTGVSARVQSTSSSSSYYGSMTVQDAVFDQVGAVREMSVVSRTNRLDARHNYFGVFPDVLDVVTVGPTNRANLEGFIGIPFDETWSKGRYYGGETIDSDIAWLSDVIITGQLDVTSGATVTIAPGVLVEFGCVDADNNGTGDCDIDLQNAFMVSNGTSDQPVTFTDFHTLQTANSWLYLRSYGTGGLSATYTIFEYANTGLQLESGTHVLDHVTTQHNAVNGLYVKSASDVTVTGLTTKDNGYDGIRIESSSGVSFDKSPGKTLVIKDNGRYGLYANNSTSNLSLSNCTVSGNTDAGLFFLKSSMAVDHCTLQQNGFGAWYEGNSSGTLLASDIKFNDKEGIFLVTGSGNPNPIIQGNNIYGNSVLEVGVLVDPVLSSAVSGQYKTQTDGPWTTPNSTDIHYMQVLYQENDSYNNYYQGYVLTSTAGSNIFSTSGAVSATFKDIRNWETSSVATRVQSTSSSSSYYGGMTVLATFYYADSSSGDVKEVAAITDGGTVNCTDNYWGLGLENLSLIPTRLTLGRQTAVDYSGYVGTEKSGTGPQ